MILLCGSPDDSPVTLVQQALEGMGIRAETLYPQSLTDAALDFEVTDGDVNGLLRIGHKYYHLQDVQGVYVRSMECRAWLDPGVHASDPQARLYCQRFLEAYENWLEITPARVVSRPGVMASNSSKPYQLQLISQVGLTVPDTLVTNDPELVLAFWREHRRIIYKSVSGARSIVRLFDADDLGRLSRILWCPTQFQVFVPGTNVRVHVIGEDIHATRVSTDAVDYRYAKAEGFGVNFYPITIDSELEQQCLRLAQALQLPFAGIDLIVGDDGRTYFLEVNPSPGFSFYEERTDQPISRSVGRLLAGYI